MSSWAAVQSLGHSIGLMALIVLVYGHIHTALACSPHCREVVIGALFGAATVVSMVDPIVLVPDIPADLRMVMILLAGPFGGPVAVLVCESTALVFRVLEGGPGTLSGAVSILIAIPVAIACGYRMKPKVHLLRARDFLALGMLSATSLFSVLTGAAAHAERLRELIERTPFTTGEANLTITASFGVAMTNRSMDEPAQLLRLGDEALGRAKSSGRNQVKVAEVGADNASELQELARSMRRQERTPTDPERSRALR